jgi:hypothetical protein
MSAPLLLKELILHKKPKNLNSKRLEACIGGKSSVSTTVILTKRDHLQKWGSPFTNYFINLTLHLTLFLGEGGSSFGTTGFFLLAVTGFFNGAMLSLVVGVSFSISASTNTCKFL